MFRDRMNFDEAIESGLYEKIDFSVFRCYNIPAPIYVSVHLLMLLDDPQLIEYVLNCTFIKLSSSRELSIQFNVIETLPDEFIIRTDVQKVHDCNVLSVSMV